MIRQLARQLGVHHEALRNRIKALEQAARLFIARDCSAVSLADSRVRASSADCEYDWIDRVIGIDDGAVRLGACLSDFPWGCIPTTPCDAVVPWDGSIAFGDRIRCTARRTGLECEDRSGGGFVVSREGYEITS